MKTSAERRKVAEYQLKALSITAPTLKDAGLIGPMTGVPRIATLEAAGTTRGAILLTEWLASTNTTRSSLAAASKSHPTIVSNWASGLVPPTRVMKMRLRVICGIPCETWSEGIW
jgi:hypothetical protein